MAYIFIVSITPVILGTITNSSSQNLYSDEAAREFDPFATDFTFAAGLPVELDPAYGKF